MSFNVFLRELAQKELNNKKKIAKNYRDQILEDLDDLAKDPAAKSNVKPVSGFPGYFRMRTSVYRTIYRVDIANKKITVELIGHRKEAYRNLKARLTS